MKILTTQTSRENPGILRIAALGLVGSVAPRPPGEAPWRSADASMSAPLAQELPRQDPGPLTGRALSLYKIYEEGANFDPRGAFKGKV